MQESLFDDPGETNHSQASYLPRRPEFFRVERIVLAKGSVDTDERRRLVEDIIALYPQAQVEERTNVPHNRVQLPEPDPLERHRAGKRTLVFGVHQSAVRFSEEADNTCPNYWHLSPYSFCPYDCAYCYLAGTRSVILSPAVKIFVNLPEIMDEIDREARRLNKPTAFYLGKLQDALALDPLTGYSRRLIPFFAGHPNARLTLLTKCADVQNLLDLKHNGHTHLAWSVNPPEIHEAFETNVPSPAERIKTMQQCASAGYPVRAALMPLIPVDGWQEIYTRFMTGFLHAVPLTRLTMGGICSYNDGRRLMEFKLGQDNPISAGLENPARSKGDYRARFSASARIEMYRALIAIARSIRPDLELALCLEDDSVMQAVGLEGCRGRCNCVL